jgi:hypothetical protein
MMLPLSEQEIQRFVAECGKLRIPDVSQEFEPYTDYITNVLLTVLDLQMQNTVVENSIRHYKKLRFTEIRSLDELELELARFPDTRDGNKAAAMYLWGNNHWARIGWLRGFVRFLRSEDLTSQEKLRAWAVDCEFERDFQGRVKYLGIAACQWLRIRLGVDTVKPDVHVHRFVKEATGRSLSDVAVIAVVEEAAKRLGVSARALDLAIWESGRGGPGAI